MPTPAKLVSAILFAALCWWVGEMVVRHSLPEGQTVGRMREVLALGGLIVGWKYIGKAATGQTGRGNRIAYVITAGVGAAVIMLILTLALHSAAATLEESLSSKYTEVGLAAEAWMEYALKDFQLAAHPIVLATLFAGSAVVGLLAGIVGRVTR
ncbi:TrgA family protein [Jannaschia ovalis]|uniref:TrgA family protein n=1 Tax=Jannaschia ovalis TaxID=3038773 RepID=A0ABY8LE36_9RHOB|nr:TrgA family protein [Jannaschia sp. GRR-S6-38]WGH78433.1 TrgA family protein [Jannaschia sp. GRR-S6-38]